VPEQVNPDGWLETIHGRAFARKVGTDGVVDVDDEHYSIKQELAGHQVVLFVNAPDRTFEVWLEGRIIKSLPRKRPLWSGNGLGGVCGAEQGASPLSRTALA
jgi:Mu transposase, C-terminal domain